VHAIVDAEAAPRELVRLPDRLRLVEVAAAATERLLPPGSHVDALCRARRVARATANAVADGGAHAITSKVLMDGILRARDRLGGSVAVLPTLDKTPLGACQAG
jgi:hypothetical protein